MKRRDTKVQAIHVRIDEVVAAKFKLLVEDPITGKSSYGKKAHIVEELIKRLINAAREDDDTIVVRDLINVMINRS